LGFRVATGQNNPALTFAVNNEYPRVAVFTFCRRMELDASMALITTHPSIGADASKVARSAANACRLYSARRAKSIGAGIHGLECNSPAVLRGFVSRDSRARGLQNQDTGGV
jgi:hypothetical protein